MAGTDRPYRPTGELTRHDRTHPCRLLRVPLRAGATAAAPIPPAPAERRRLALVPAGHPARATRKPLGTPAGHPPGAATVGLAVADARHHLHVLGLTGTGKSTWLAGHALAEAAAGRGMVLIDCQGDLARHVLTRLPAPAAGRVVLLDPDETTAPPAWNVLAPDTNHRSHSSDGRSGGDAGTATGASAERGRAAEWAAENVVTVFRRLSGGVWGPRMDDLMRAACLTLARRPGSTIADIVPLLTDTGFRRNLLARHGEPDGLTGYWHGHDELSPGGRAQLCGPVLARLRSVLARRFARDLLACPAATINLTDILDGGILIARLPKGQIGEDTSRLIGSLLLSGLWSAATRRAHQPPDQRCKTPRSSSTNATTSCTCPSAWTTRWPKPAATASPSCSPTNTSPNCPPTSPTRSTPTPATRSTSPCRPTTPATSPATPPPSSTTTTSPPDPPSTPASASCTTARPSRRSPSPPRRCPTRPRGGRR